jgi:ribosome-associated toxin RatA of RatAB toxin-antitoxin module
MSSAILNSCRTQNHVIVSRGSSGSNEILVTDMTMARGIFRETIRSRDTLDRKNCRILVEATAGPLQSLRTLWTFRLRDAESCDVAFDLIYEFSNPLRDSAKAAPNTTHPFLLSSDWGSALPRPDPR